jgi:hypothetical protein
MSKTKPQRAKNAKSSTVAKNATPAAVKPVTPPAAVKPVTPPKPERNGLSDDVKDEIVSCFALAEFKDTNLVRLPKVRMSTYAQVVKILRALGTSWDKQAGAHRMAGDAAALLAGAIHQLGVKPSGAYKLKSRGF